MTRQQVTDAVFDAIERAAGREAELADTSTDLGIDSLDRVEIAIELEQSLGMDCDGQLCEWYGGADTVQNLIDEICKATGI